MKNKAEVLIYNTIIFYINGIHFSVNSINKDKHRSLLYYNRMTNHSFFGINLRKETHEKQNRYTNLRKKIILI